MKNITAYVNITLFFCLLIFFQSCGHHDSATLDELEKIKIEGDSVPKEALKKLESFSKRIKTEDEYVKMKYNLLKIRLQDKSDIIPENDKLAKQVYDYFQKNGNDNEKAETAYYLASVYRDLHDSPRAVTFFLQSEDLSLKCDLPDSTLLANTYSQLRGLYEAQYNDKAALNMAIKQLELVRRNKKLLNPTRIMDVATCYSNIGDTLNAIKYQDWALNEIIETHSEEENSDIIAELTLAYLRQNLKQKADFCKNKLLNISKDRLAENYDHNLGVFYLELGQLDSAYIYFSYVFNNPIDPTYKENANIGLLMISLDKKNNDSIIKYAKAYIKSAEESELFMKREVSANARNEYIYRRDKEQEALAYQAAEKAKNNLLVTIFCFTSIVALIIIVTQYFRLKNIKRINRQQAIIKEKSEEIKNKTDLIEEQSQLLQEKDKILKKKTIQNKTLYQTAYLKKLEETNEDVAKIFLLASEGKVEISDADWQMLYSIIDKDEPKFKDAILKRISKPKEDMIKIAYLIKTGFTNPQICKITNYKNTTVWRKTILIRKALSDFLKEEEENSKT